jgi:hypothetical protein
MLAADAPVGFNFPAISIDRIGVSRVPVGVEETRELSSATDDTIALDRHATPRP